MKKKKKIKFKPNIDTLSINARKVLGTPLDDDDPITNPRKFRKSR